MGQAEKRVAKRDDGTCKRPSSTKEKDAKSALYFCHLAVCPFVLIFNFFCLKFVSRKYLSVGQPSIKYSRKDINYIVTQKM